MANKQISEIIHKAMLALNPKFVGFGPKYKESIHRQGCDYVFVAAYQGTEAIEDTVIIVDQAGHIKTLPLCCYIQDCPEWCASN